MHRTLLGIVGLFAVVASVVVGAAPSGAGDGDITLHAEDLPSARPNGGAVVHPDGTMWFGSQRLLATGYLLEVQANGDVTPHEIAEHTRIYDVTVGGDGNVWFTTLEDEIGRFDPDTDTYELFDAPVELSVWITTGPSGSVWVLGNDDGAGEVLLDGSLGSDVDFFGFPRDIMLGPDGNIWISRSASDFYKVDPADGSFEIIETPDGGDDPTFLTPVRPRQMTIGPDGKIWFTYGDGEGNGGVGTYDIDADVFETFPFATDRQGKGITFGADGNVWFLTAADDSISRMTPDGVTTTFADPGFDLDIAPSSEIIAGPDGDLWASGEASIAEVDIIPPECLPPAFGDVSASHTFLEDICWMDIEEISTGYPDGTYRPSAPVSRQAMSAFMYRLAGQPAFSPPAPDDTTFGDVSASNDFYLEIEWMASEGITTGTAASPKPLYKPSAPVSRGAMSAFMYRFADEPLFTPSSPSFTDVSAGHPFFKEIEWMADTEISTGYLPGPTYRPGTAVSRQAMSAFMHRLAPLLDA